MAVGVFVQICEDMSKIADGQRHLLRRRRSLAPMEMKVRSSAQWLLRNCRRSEPTR
jgi:hypothetical protein